MLPLLDGKGRIPQIILNPDAAVRDTGRSGCDMTIRAESFRPNCIQNE